MITAKQATDRIIEAEKEEMQREIASAMKWCDEYVSRDIEERSSGKLSFVAYDLEKSRFGSRFIEAAVAFIQAHGFTVTVEEIERDNRITIEWPTTDQAA